MTRRAFLRSSFDKKSLDKESFDKSSLKGSSFHPKSFYKTSLEDSSLAKHSFTKSSLADSSFHKPSFKACSFTATSFEELSFATSSLEESSFSESSFEQSSLKANNFDCSLAARSFQEASLESDSFSHTAWLTELETSSFGTELGQLEASPLEKGAFSLELPTAPSGASKRDLAPLVETELLKACLQGGVLSSKSLFYSLTLDKLEHPLLCGLKSALLPCKRKLLLSKLSIFVFFFSIFCVLI